MPTNREVNERLLRLFEQGDTLDDQLQEFYQKALANHYQESLDYVRSELAAIYNKFGEDVTFADMASFNRLTNLEKRIREELRRLLGKSVGSIRSSITDQYVQAYQYGAYSVENTLKVAAGFGGLSTESIQASIVNPLSRIRWQDSAGTAISLLEQRTRGAISQGLITGQGFRKTADRITELMEGSVNNDMLRIVRTESHRAQSAGRTLAFEKSENLAGKHGFDVRRKWKSTIDSRTRPKGRKAGRRGIPNHRLIDGQVAKLQKDGTQIFTFSDGVKTQGPGLSGVAGHDINCRCTTYLEFVGLSPRFRREQIDNSTIPNMSYVEFLDLKDSMNLPPSLRS